MTAKTATKPNRGFSAAISRVEPALAAWRQRRKHREAIPDALWQALVPLARVHGVSPVAQALRLNYTALKRHLVAEPAPPGWRDRYRPGEVCRGTGGSLGQWSAAGH